MILMFDFTWILPSLCFHVQIKILVMCIRIVTFVALICSPPRICLQNNEDHHSLKTFATLTALIHGFFQGHVITSCKTSILSKTLLHCLHWYSSPQWCVTMWSFKNNLLWICHVTWAAFIWFLTRVCVWKAFYGYKSFKKALLLWIHWYSFSPICVCGPLDCSSLL